MASAPIPLAAQGTPTAVTRTGPQDVILATTTSTADTGLLDALAPLFKEATGYTLKPIAVGSGAALALGEAGEADVVLSHSPQAEADFMAAGFGEDRRTVMYNDFVIVGPAERSSRDQGRRLGARCHDRRLPHSQSPFVSRGDDSGTNALELRLWKQAGVEPAGDWYVESGTGMGDTLNIANERQAYTISDRGTYLALKDRLDLPILVEGDRVLLNVYHVITLNPDNGPNINTAGGEAFAGVPPRPTPRTSSAALASIASASRSFTPCADNSCGVEATATPVATPELEAAA